MLRSVVVSRIGTAFTVAMALSAVACGKSDDSSEDTDPSPDIQDDSATDTGANDDATSDDDDTEAPDDDDTEAPDDDDTEAPDDADTDAPDVTGPDYPVHESLMEGPLLATLTALADPELAGRAAGSPGDAAARAQIEERFRSLGLSPIGQGFQQDFIASDGSETANVIATVPGTDAALASEVIIIGAHHDHLGEDESGIFPGANDDASGVALVLGLAGYFAEHPARRTLVFAAFGAEELDLDGSKYFVEHPEPGFALDDTVFMVNLDMVGVYDQFGIVNALNTYPGTPGRVALDALLPEVDPDCDVEPGVECRVGNNGLRVALGEEGIRADHLPFCEAGVPVSFFFTEDEECYHDHCDTADRIDGAGMALIAQVVAALIDELADGDADLAAARGTDCSN